MKRLAAAVTAAFLVMLAVPGVANAYGGGSTSGTPSTTSTSPTSTPTSPTSSAAPTSDSADASSIAVTMNESDGSTVVPFQFDGFAPFEWVSFYSTSGAEAFHAAGAAFVQAPAGKLIARVQADANGVVTLSIKFSEVGSAIVTAVGETSGHVTTTTVTVAEVGAAAGDGSGLSSTGVNRTLLLAGSAGGVLALIIGGGLVWLGATKRRSLHHAA